MKQAMVEDRNDLVIAELPQFSPLGLDPAADEDGLTVPPELFELLFGGSEGDLLESPSKVGSAPLPPIKTYALLDAAKLPNILLGLIEASDLPYRSLIQGEALNDIEEQVPYLVELSADNSLTRTLFTSEEAGAGLFEKELGLFLRTRMGFTELWRHLRKFNRLESEEGKWFYFRFWSPPISTQLLRLGNHPALVQLIGPMFPSAPMGITIIVLSESFQGAISRRADTQPPLARPRITEPVREIMKSIRRWHQFREVSEIAFENCAPKLDLSRLEALAALERKGQQYFKLGFWRRDHIAKLCCWELLLGPDFLETYKTEDGRVVDAFRGQPKPHEIINRIEKLLDPPEPEPTEAEFLRMMEADNAEP